MISRSDIDAAALRLEGLVRHTPVMHLAAGDLGMPFPVTLKLECLQHAGSFKPRGAFNRILNAESLPAAGVIAASGGNHGIAVAYAAKARGLAAEIFVPAATPEAKAARIQAYGAHLVRIGADYAEAAEASHARAAETGALQIHAYDHPDVLAGQGTVGREFAADAPDLTHVLVATGGGGLIGGISTWYAGRAEVISVEPDTCPTLFAALSAGVPVDVPTSGVAADSLGARRIGALGLAAARNGVSRAVLVTDAAILAARKRLWQELQLLVETGGATALAALTAGAWTPPPGARVGVVVCGANTGSLPD